MTAPASPPAARHRLPSWLDLRLVLGVLLVLASVLAGAKLFLSADRTVRVWAVTGDLAAGTVLAADDVRSVPVRLVENPGRYLRAGRSPAGQTLTRDIGRDELLPEAALRPELCGSLVSIPVSSQHVPGSIAKGQRIDVYATAKSGDRKTSQVLRAVPVQAVQRPRGGLVAGGGEWSVVVRVPDGLPVRVVQAIRGAEIDVTVADQPVKVAADGCGAPDQPAADTAATGGGSGPGQGAGNR
jgi:hypothetical protein